VPDTNEAFVKQGLHRLAPNAGLEPRTGQAGVLLNNDPLVLQAALAGRGLALGWSNLVAPLLGNGALVKVGPAVAQADAYHVCWPARPDLDGLGQRCGFSKLSRRFGSCEACVRMIREARMVAAKVLSGAEAAYRRDGFLFPIEVMTPEEARALRSRLEAIESTYRDGPRQPLVHYLRAGAHYVLPLAAEIARHPQILDAVEAVLGPDLLVWSAEFITKEAGTTSIVSWHQDLTYWGMGATEHEVTAWLALSPATPESGCMRFMPGSHHQDLVAHHDTFAENNLLSRGQEIAVEVDEAEAVPVILQPGQISLHHGRMFHASGPNRSADRRIAVVIRYITPEVRKDDGMCDYAMLVRGVDRRGHFIHVAPPVADFAPSALDLHDEVTAAQAAALAEGATQPLAY